MKILYCDTQLGASGDMLVGALLDLGLPVSVLQQQLSSLSFSNFAIAPVKVTRHGISGIQAGITSAEDHHHRNIASIKEIIDAASCSDRVKNNAMAVFETLARAESHIHGIPVEEVHFHEIGAIDSIVDILAFCIGIEYLGIDKLLYSAFAFGVGTILTQHGIMPLPAPATLKITEGKQIFFTDKKGELTTPTAAAILTALGDQSASFQGLAAATGIGFGTRDYGFPSYTRVLLLEDTQTTEYQSLCVLECTIDDMNPELIPYVADVLLHAGALDVNYHQVIAKKGRPGIVLWLLCQIENSPKLREIIFSQTTTLGVRAYTVDRYSLPRETATISLYGETIRIKTASRFKELSPKPEFEDCKAVALKTGKPLINIIEEAMEAYYKQAYNCFSSSCENI